jgi:hypothetical protein
MPIYPYASQGVSDGPKQGQVRGFVPIGMLEFWNIGIMGFGIDLFPLFVPSVPTFHHSIVPCGFPTWMAIKNTIFPKSCRKSETSNYIG